MDGYFNSSNMRPTGGIWCGEPVLTKHAYIAYQSGFTYPHIVEIACQDGYVLHGPKIVRCEIDGLWTGSPTCHRPGEKIPWWAPLIGIGLFLPITLYALIKLYDRCFRRGAYSAARGVEDLTCEQQLVPSSECYSNDVNDEPGSPRPNHDDFNLEIGKSIFDYGINETEN